MLNPFIQLADEVVQSSQQNSCFEKLKAVIDDVSNLEVIIKLSNQSNNLLFCFTTILSKSILNGEFSTINETRSEQNITHLDETEENKLKIYGGIINYLFELIVTSKRQSYIIKSCINLMSVCLKSLFESSGNVKYLSTSLNFLLPNFRLDEKFGGNYQNELVMIEPWQGLTIAEVYPTSLAIFKSLLEYVTTSAYFKTYYDYRRNIYTFRNSYLSIFLNIAVVYAKLLLYQWETNHHNQKVHQYLTETFLFLEQITMFPFTLNLQEYENQEEAMENIAGICGGEVYFPNFFRHVLCDLNFVRRMLNYFIFVTSYKNVKLARDQVNALIKIVGRFSCASPYCFNTEEQRKNTRNFSVEVVIALSKNSKMYEPYTLHSLCDIFSKIISTFSESDFGYRKLECLDWVMNFIQEIICTAEIHIEDGKRNALSKACMLLNACYDQAKSKEYSGPIETKCELILNQLFIRISNNIEVEAVMKEFGFNKKIEIECFQEFFENVPPIFHIHLNNNLQKLQALDLMQMNISAQTFWLHLCSQLLPSHQANLAQTTIILKYLAWAKNANTLACLRYIHTLVTQVLMEFQEGISNTSLWRNIEEIQKITFQNFIMGIINLCVRNFSVPHEEILSYSLQIFKSIYTKLKKNHNKTFEAFYRVVIVLLQNIEKDTVFCMPKFLKNRVDFFNVISIIWINNKEYKYIYQIYQVISNKFTEDSTLMTLLCYMSDVSGLLSPIQHYEPFKVLAELALKDLNVLLPLFLGTKQQIYEGFSDYAFLKSFCRMVLIFCTDSSHRISYDTHTSLPYQINNLFSRYMKEISESDYDYPKTVVSIFSKLPSLDQKCPLLRFRKDFKEKLPLDYNMMLKEYFQHIHRVPDLMFLFDFIEGNTQYMSEWWEEVMNRGGTPDIKLANIIEARIWNNRRQKQNLAKTVYQVGRYNQQYWNIKPFKNQKEFVTAFMDTYK